MLAVLVAVAGCGSGGGAGTTTTALGARDHRPKALTVYVSLPFNGPQAPQARSVLNGIKLALSELPNGKAGAYRLKLRTHDDSGVFAHGWTRRATAANARRAATNPDAILYIGDLDSGASAISIPILKQAGIPQISPGSTATNLTPPSSTPQPPAEPATFLRLVPDDHDAATSNLLALHKLGCTRTVVVGDSAGQGLITAMKGDTDPVRREVHLLTVGKTALGPKTSAEITSYVESARSQDGCVFYSGVPSPNAIALIRAVRVSLPANLAVVGSSQLCNASWAQSVAAPSSTENPAEARTTSLTTAAVSAVGQRPPPATATTRDVATTTTSTGTTTTGDHGSPPATDTGIWCTSPTPDLRESSQGQQFIQSYKRGHGGAAPDLPAIFGYETMQFGIRAIRQLGTEADGRQEVLDRLHEMCIKHSALGPFTFEENGSSTLTAYSLYTVRSGGSLSFDRWLSKPPPSSVACSGPGR